MSTRRSKRVAKNKDAVSVSLDEDPPTSAGGEKKDDIVAPPKKKRAPRRNVGKDLDTFVESHDAFVTTQNARWDEINSKLEAVISSVEDKNQTPRQDGDAEIPTLPGVEELRSKLSEVVTKIEAMQGEIAGIAEKDSQSQNLSARVTSVELESMKLTAFQCEISNINRSIRTMNQHLSHHKTDMSQKMSDVKAEIGSAIKSDMQSAVASATSNLTSTITSKIQEAKASWSEESNRAIAATSQSLRSECNADTSRAVQEAGSQWAKNMESSMKTHTSGLEQRVDAAMRKMVADAEYRMNEKIKAQLDSAIGQVTHEFKNHVDTTVAQMVQQFTTKSSTAATTESSASSGAPATQNQLYVDTNVASPRVKPTPRSSRNMKYRDRVAMRRGRFR